MKKLNFFFCFLFLINFSQAQNLVPNPSFEDTIACPTALTQINQAVGWSSFSQSPDYFNACNQAGLNVPNAIFGFQHANSGNAMSGLSTYRKPNSPCGPNCREIIGVQLISPLNIGQKYFVSFFTNFAHTQNVAIATNKIGARFTNFQYTSSNIAPVDNFAHLFTDSILQDSVLWIKISGSFIADSSYNYLMIGNFFDDNNTSIINLGALPDYSYYYIDDVCVTTDSLYNETWTGLNYIASNTLSINVYPNPFANTISIESPEPIYQILLYNTLGQIVYTESSDFKLKQKIYIPDLPQGFYFINLKTKTSSTSVKVQLIY